MLYMYCRDKYIVLPCSNLSVRYRVIVQNSDSEESPASVSVMVRPSKLKTEATSLLSKLEKKYMNSSDISSKFRLKCSGSLY